MAIRLGSLFDGIGGFPLAASRHGIKTVWASEIEPFPIKVTKHHFPDMEHLGDITQINGAEIEPVDIITFGSPCQDLSVAGKRGGLSGERSGLFMDAIRIIRQMRTATGGEYPRFAVWENVPGAFSSNKRQDFRAVLEEITETEIPMPASGKWATAGMVRTERVDVAWRVLDAQYWGVPQRRKRIFLVADFRGQRATEILFVEEGLSGDIAESGEAREGITADVEGSTSYAIQLCGDRKDPGVSVSKKAFCIPANPMSDRGQAVCAERGVGKTICFEPGAASRLGGYCNEELCGTLRADMGDNQPAIVTPKTMLVRSGKEGGGKGPLISEDKSLTLGCNNDQAVFTFAQQRSDEYKESNVSHTLAQQDYKDATDLMVGALCARDYKGVGNQYVNEGKCIVDQYAVRRLTPLECERLMGFPDYWTDIPGASDTARYKALGNSIAIPCLDYIFQNMSEVLREGRA